MAIINGMTRVNGGTIAEVNGKQYELLGGAFSSHTHRIVCDYFIDENGRKVVISYADTDHVEVYFFKNRNDLHFYRSYRYKSDEVPQKYQKKVEELKRLFRDFH